MVSPAMQTYLRTAKGQGHLSPANPLQKAYCLIFKGWVGFEITFIFFLHSSLVSLLVTRPHKGPWEPL